MNEYVKADQFVGKSLTLNVGRGDVTIEDGKVYRGAHFENFVDLGFLKRAPKKALDDEVAKAPPAPAAPAASSEPEAARTPHPETSQTDPAINVFADSPALEKADSGDQDAAGASSEASASETSSVDTKPEKGPENGSMTRSPMDKVKSGARRTRTKKLDD